MIEENFEKLYFKLSYKDLVIAISVLIFYSKIKG